MGTPGFVAPTPPHAARVPALLEREPALAVIDAALTRAAGGQGSAVLIEGEAGIGKTRLLDEAVARAARAGLTVGRASGADGEGVLAWGVAEQLTGRLLTGCSADELAALFEGLSPVAQAVFGGVRPQPAAGGGEDELAVAHAFFTVLRRRAQTRPALIVVDDLHWADPASIRLLLYLLQRLADLPAGVIMARRPNEPGEENERAAVIAAHPATTVIELAPLGRDAVNTLAHDTLGALAVPRLVDVCLARTGGNPFYLNELLAALAHELPAQAATAEGADLIDRLSDAVPRSVAITVAVRIGRRGADAVALSRALAVLGDGAHVRQCAALAGLELAAAANAADDLVAAGILHAGDGLTFAHPLLRSAVDRDLSAGRRSELHRAAARLLDADGVPSARVAAHLLAAAPAGDPWVVAVLRAAATEMLRDGAAGAAIRCLRRALAEPPQPAVRAAVLRELGQAEAAGGQRGAAGHLEEAARLSEPGLERAQIGLALARALHADGRHADAVAALDAALGQLDGMLEPGEGEDGSADASPALALHDELQAAFVAIALLVPTLLPEAQRRTDAVLSRAHATDTHGRRALLAHAAGWRAVMGRPRTEVIQLAETAWAGGRLLQEETSRGLAWTFITGAYTQAGEFRRSVSVADAALTDARRRSDPLSMALALYVRGCPRLMLGDVSGALEDLQEALAARAYGWRQYARAGAGYCAAALVLAGRLDAAHELIEEQLEGDGDPTADLEEIALVGARAQLRLARGEFGPALADAITMRDSHEIAAGFAGPWRDVGALAALGLSDRDLALEFARRELDRGRTADVTYLRVNGLRMLGLATGGADGLGLLRKAVAAGDREAPNLSDLQALIDLGAALRRANRRAEARPLLQRADDLAWRAGAMTLHERARTELVATGARPRRGALLSGRAALTASERRVADLAADGRTNREIAQALYVTPKTVEYHLRNAYLKLGIASRAQLAAALRD